MKERPILMSAPMVRASLEGRKTQTRRIVKPQPSPKESVQYDTITGQAVYEDDESSRIIDCPYGRPGDRLWVRETFQQVWANTPREEDDDSKRIPDFWTRPKTPAWGTHENYWIYRADGVPPAYPILGRLCWRPSIHMPRQASRITLEITAVRVERLQDISYDDAVAEGIEHEYPKAVSQYRELWEQINGPGTWFINPMVWVLEFKRI